MGTVRRHMFIDAPAHVVWGLVGAPESLHEWFPIVSTRMEGHTRWITLANGLVFEEEVVTLDHDLRRFQYRIVNNPIVTSHLGTVDVIEDGPSRCLVVYSTDMEPEVLALPIAGAAGEGLGRLARRFGGSH